MERSLSFGQDNAWRFLLVEQDPAIPTSAAPMSNRSNLMLEEPVGRPGLHLAL